jgi:Flp pilus assembly protein TadG
MVKAARLWAESRPRRALARLVPRLARRFRRDPSGVSAVEFALILPIMMTLYFGIVEVGDALVVDRKVTHVTSTICDLVAQSKTISPTDMSNFMDASQAIIYPYDTSLLKIVVSQVAIDSKGKATISWSDARNTTALAKNSAVTLPSGVTENSTYLVMATVSYRYTPTIGYIMTGPVTLSETFYLRPRLATTGITHT